MKKCVFLSKPTGRWLDIGQYIVKCNEDGCRYSLSLVLKDFKRKQSRNDETIISNNMICSLCVLFYRVVVLYNIPLLRIKMCLEKACVLSQNATENCCQ